MLESIKLVTYAGWYNPFVMVRIDTNAVLLKVKGILAEFYVLQFVLVNIRPSPNA